MTDSYNQKDINLSPEDGGGLPPWKEVVDDADANFVSPQAAPLLVAGMTMTSLPAGNYKFTFNAGMVQPGFPGANPVSMNFWLYKNGAPVPYTNRNEHLFDSQGNIIGMGDVPTIVKIVTGVVPGDLWEIFAQNVGAAGTATVQERTFSAMQVGTEIP